MPDEPLTLAVVGLGDLGEDVLEALRGLDGARLVAVGDRDVRLAETAGKARGVPFFTDQRQLLSQVRPDVVVLTTPPSAAPELVRLAARAGSHVIKAAPLARTLDEAVDLVAAADAAQTRLAVLAPRRFNPSYRQLILQRDRLGPLFLARALVLLNWGPQFGWRGDRETAGGGVLLEAGYEMLDLLVWALGLPEEVYAVTGHKGRPLGLPADGADAPLGLYDTDDTAIVALRYTDATAAMLTASWVTAPPSEELALHGQRAIGQAGPDRLVLCDPDGQRIEQDEGQVHRVAALGRQLRDLLAAFARSASRYESSGREHLLTMAAVQAAYLSDRTGTPERPGVLLQQRSQPLEACLAARPAELAP